jgi:RNA polymerase sigma factor (sigma-70 family)
MSKEFQIGKRKRKGSVLDLYLYSITQNHLPLLSAKDEQDLGRRIQRGDPEARARLIECNLHLVIFVVSRFFGDQEYSFEDMVAEGNLGLIHAAETFDPDLSIRFCTYATCWIRQSVQRACFTNRRDIRLPVHVGRLLALWYRTRDQLRYSGGDPNDNSILAALNITRNEKGLLAHALEVIRALGRSEMQRRNCEAMGKGDEDMTGSLDPSSPGENSELVNSLLAKLNSQQRIVISLRFGLGDNQEKTFREIAEVVGMTRQGVHQVYKTAMRQLSNPPSLPAV